MNREEAIKKLQKQKADYLEEWVDYSGVAEAFDMAIEALSEPKTIIGIDIPYGSDKGIATIFKGNEKMVLEEVKEIMAVVRCKDCRYLNRKVQLAPKYYLCTKHTNNHAVQLDDYCSWGERSSNE